MPEKTTPNALRQEINNCIDLMLEARIALTANAVVLQQIGHRVRVTWEAAAQGGNLQAANAFATVGEYCDHLQNQAYSAVLYDGSLLQLSFDFKGTKLAGHRLCFYPCPFDVDPSDFDTAPFLDVIELYRSDGESFLRLRSPIRFDYDPGKASDGHPSVHAHFLWGHCRCAVGAPLSVGHFLQFVFGNFFPELWGKHEFLRDWKRRWWENTITDDEAFSLHLAARSREAMALLEAKSRP